MIAKASTISHGANAIRYSVNKKKADIVKANLLLDNISPEAMYGRMMLVQRKFAEHINKGRPLGRNVIRIEISPSEEESRGWTMDDWTSLSNEFIHVFDSIDLSGKTKRTSSKQTNLKGSQYIVALHRDSKSGILHLHIDANRVDMNGKINDSHKIGERAVMAANIINERRGWVQSEEIGIRHRAEISDSCMEILRTMDNFSWQRYETELVKLGYKVHLQEKEGGGVYGYSIKRGNSIYKENLNKVTDKADAVTKAIDSFIAKVRDIKFKAKVDDADMEQAINNRKKLIENESKLLEDHRKENKEILTRHFYDMSNMMSRNEGVWLSNGWVKALLWIFLPCFLYTSISIVYLVASYIDK